MKVEDLAGVGLSDATKGYIGIYLKLSDLFGELSDVSEREYGLQGDAINEAAYNALTEAQSEVLKLAMTNIKHRILSEENHTEI